MSLRARLAARRLLAVEPMGSNPTIADESGIFHQRWVFPLEQRLSDPRLWPSGYSEMAPPPFARVTRGLQQLEAVVSDEPRLVAFDLETTGAGSEVVPFVVGLAWQTEKQLHVAQWTLRRLESERTMLIQLSETWRTLFDKASRLVTFNGASFDMPVIRRRFRRLGIGEVPALRHVDLLPVARRLWRGVGPNCRLTTLESKVLGIHRRGDIEGREVAAVFTEWLAAPNDPWLQAQVRRVEQHNRADVVSLVALTSAAGMALTHPEQDRLQASLRAGQHYAQLQRWDEALEHLHRVAKKPAPRSPRARSEWRDACVLAAQIERRLGRSKSARVLWQAVCEAFPGDEVAHEALAKLLEHDEHRYREALAVALRAREPSLRRVARLRRKLGRNVAAR